MLALLSSTYFLTVLTATISDLGAIGHSSLLLTQRSILITVTEVTRNDTEPITHLTSTQVTVCDHMLAEPYINLSSTVTSTC